MDMEGFWKAVLDQDREALPAFFADDAEITWPNTNERFTVSEFIRVNCDYPGRWQGNVERTETREDLTITVTHVYNREKTTSCHAVSFFRIRDGRILSAEEYWGDDGQPPRWRQAMQIGRPIRGSEQCTM